MSARSLAGRNTFTFIILIITADISITTITSTINIGTAQRRYARNDIINNITHKRPGESLTARIGDMKLTARPVFCQRSAAEAALVRQARQDEELR